MGYEIAVLTALVIYFSGISAQDIKYRKISNCAPIILMMSAPFVCEISFSQQIIGLAAVFIPLFAINVITDGFGMGDVKLCAAFGFVIGAFAEYVALALALTTAIIIGKITNIKSLPLAPFICTASMTALIMEVFTK